MSLATPLNRVLGLGSAKDGTEHWWGQRLSAVALAVLGVWLTISVTSFESFSYQAVVSWMQSPLSCVMLILTVLTLCYHSQLGVQVVVEDYVRGKGARVLTLVVVRFLHVLVGVAAAFAVLRLALGG